jgi:hypothetical protein
MRSIITGRRWTGSSYTRLARAQPPQAPARMSARPGQTLAAKRRLPSTAAIIALLTIIALLNVFEVSAARIARAPPTVLMCPALVDRRHRGDHNRRDAAAALVRRGLP